MRTTPAAASAVTSAELKMPQPASEGLKGEGTSSDAAAISKSNSLSRPREGTSLAPFSSLNAADMLSQYKNASLEFGTGGKVTTGPGGQTLYKAVGFGDAAQAVDVSQGARQLARELDEFVAKGQEGILAAQRGDPGAPSDDAIADLQLQTARKLRQLLPTNKELLHLVQERNWIPLLLGWLNLHDRPAVQVEALLALTNIAELCAQQSYYQHTHAQSSAAAAAAAAAQAAAAAAVKAVGSKLPDSSFYFPSSSDVGNSSSSTSSSYGYPPLVAPNPGGVPFPPLSFSQTLSPEALAAFDASLSSTIQQSKSSIHGSKASSGYSAAPVSLGLNSFPPSALPHSFPPSSLSSAGGLPFSTTLAPSPSGSTSLSSSSNAMIPPPTPVPSSNIGGGSTFPQQLSASSQHLLLRHADAIPTLISLLSSPNREVYEQAMWILGSIAAGDSAGSGSGGSNASGSNSSESGREKSVAARDVILAAGIMNQLLRCLETHANNLSLQRIGSWTLSNLVEGIFQQSSHSKTAKSSDYSSSDEIEMVELLPVLRRLLRMADAEVLSYTCWTLSHLCDGPSSHISAVVTTRDPQGVRGGLVPRLVELLLHPSWRVTKPALRTIGNIVCAECSDENNHGSASPTDYTEIILDCDAVPRLKELVTHSNREIQKEACWTLSNIAAGTVDQIQAVIDSGAIPPLVRLVSDKSTDQEVRSEACWVVLNATSCGSDSQIEVLVDEGCVSVLGVLLGEASMVMMALEGLERVLQVEEARESARREQLENGEDDSNPTPTLVSASLIEKALEKHNSSAVTKRATRIWKQHFVSCALCHESFSKHRTADATFCEECKCYVCFKCDCKIYHLSYQEELWAVTEEKNEAKKNAKKSKNKKKKLKQKKLKQQQFGPNDPHVSFQKEGSTVRSRSSTVISSDGSESAGVSAGMPAQLGKSPPLELSVLSRASKVKGGGSTTSDVTDKHAKDGIALKNAKSSAASSSDRRKPGMKRNKEEPASPCNSDDEDVEGPHIAEEAGHDGERQQPPIDFVLYLQQTGSIIALAKLMDALDYGDGTGYNDDEFDDTELQMLRHQGKILNEQATN